MAMSNEEKAAKRLIAAIDSIGLNPAMVAFSVMDQAVNAQQHLLFQLTCALIKQWAQSDVLSLHYTPTAADMERKFLSQAMVKAIESQGYTVW